ncbi:hypothetical protein [Luteolibacter sp.]|uniref:hypothetical protein n=1 Tax=Luteolibacter sp. TaxID=1962973 RepID=UPI003266B12F
MAPRLFYLLISFAALGACSSSSTISAPSTDELGHEVASGNPLRDWIASDLKGFRSSAAPKDKVLASLGGKATKVQDVAYLNKLPHSEYSTLSIPQETIDEWGRLYTQSSETYYVMAEGGNDILLFFNKNGQLTEYVHM